jgi:hypothetical protein
MTCAPPPEGTCTTSIRALSRSCSTMMWPTLATPEVAIRSDPGLARDYTSTSAKLRPVNRGVARRQSGE